MRGGGGGGPKPKSEQPQRTQTKIKIRKMTSKWQKPKIFRLRSLLALSSGEDQRIASRERSSLASLMLHNQKKCPCLRACVPACLPSDLIFLLRGRKKNKQNTSKCCLTQQGRKRTISKNDFSNSFTFRLK